MPITAQIEQCNYVICSRCSWFRKTCRFSYRSIRQTHLRTFAMNFAWSFLRRSVHFGWRQVMMLNPTVHPDVDTGPWKEYLLASAPCLSFPLPKKDLTIFFVLQKNHLLSTYLTAMSSLFLFRHISFQATVNCNLRQILFGLLFLHFETFSWGPKNWCKTWPYEEVLIICVCMKEFVCAHAGVWENDTHVMYGSEVVHDYFRTAKNSIL